MGHLSLSKLGSRLMVWPAWLWGFGKEWQRAVNNNTWSCFKFRCFAFRKHQFYCFSFCDVYLSVCLFLGTALGTGWKQRNITLPQDKQPINEKTQWIRWFTASTQGQIERQDEKLERTVILNLYKGKWSEWKWDNQRPKAKHQRMPSQVIFTVTFPSLFS